MEREINNKIFTKLYLKIKVRGKEISDIIFCKKETTWKKRSIDYSKCEYLLHKNSNSNENMLFLRKTDKTIWKPPLSKSIPPPHFQLNPLFLSNFLWPPSLSKFQKQDTPP